MVLNHTETDESIIGNRRRCLPTYRRGFLGMKMIAILMLAACGGQSATSPVLTPTTAPATPAIPTLASPTVAPTVGLPTVTPAPAATAVPTAAPTATASPTVAPTISSPSTLATIAPTTYHMVIPQQTDPAINEANGPHIAAAPSCANPQRDFLVVYFSGTANPATQGRPLLDVALRNCMHAIGLSYPNSEAAFDDCTNDPDRDCFEKWRLQKLDGVQRSTHLTTTPPNGIENRLVKLVQYLAATFPSEGWDRYLDAGAVRWPLVIASGQSQGGGMAAILGKIHPLARVVMLASVPDTIGGFGGTAPAWTGKPGATPPDRYYGFAHMKDQYSPGEQQNWAALGLTQFGPVVNTDSASAPYKGTHMLTTDVPYDTSVPNGAHPTTIAPRNAEKFDPVWTYMLIGS